MASNAKQLKPTRKTILNSDCLTGEPLAYGTLRFPVRAWNPTRNEEPVTLVPLMLHSRRPQHGIRQSNWTGNPAFSPAFSRYLETIPDRRERQRQSFSWHYWWTGAWVEAELYAHFDARSVDVVLRIVRDQMDPEDAVARSHLTLTGMQMELRRMRKHCRAYLRSLAQRAA